MALCFVGLHDWVRVRDSTANEIYRYCRNCGKWRKFGGNYGDTYWDECDPPSGSTMTRVGGLKQ